MSASTRYQPQAFETRLDELRIELGIDLIQWQEEAGIDRRQLLKYRKGRDMRADTLVSLVRSARKLTGNRRYALISWSTWARTSRSLQHGISGYASTTARRISVAHFRRRSTL